MSLQSDLRQYPDEIAIIFEYDLPSLLVFAVNVAPFTYFVSLNNFYPWIDSAFLTGDWEVENAAKVSSVKTEEGFYVNAGSDTNCVATEGTFFFGHGTVGGYSVSGLWIHRYDGNNPLEYPCSYGVTYGFRRGGKPSYNDVSYDERLLSVPNITREKSSYYTGKSVNAGGTFTLANGDGLFDRFAIDTTGMGNPCRAKVGLNWYNYESFETFFTGYIRKFSPGLEKAKFGCKQKEDKLNIPIPQKRYELSSYPYLNASNDGKVIPLVYGSVRDFPVTCLNETQSGDHTWIFQIADTSFHDLHSISSVYVYDGDIRTSRAIASSDLAAGTVSLAAAHYEPGQVVTVDCEGFEDDGGTLIENALDIIKDLIICYGRAQDSAIYFNNSYWDDASALDAGFPIDKETNVQAAIEEITKQASLAHFQIDDDDRYSCVIFDDTAPVDLVIDAADIISVGDPEFSTEEQLAELVVKYNKMIKQNKPEVLTNTDYKENANWENEVFASDEKETLISNAADAAAFGDQFMARYGVQSFTIPVTVNLFCVTQRICAILKVPFSRPVAPNIGTWKCELIKRSGSLGDDGGRTEMLLRPFAEVIE